MSLSDKITFVIRNSKPAYWIMVDDVKEFIKELKEEIGNPVLLTKSMRSMKLHDIIDERAGENLI